MAWWQHVLLLLFLLYACIGFWVSWWQLYKKKNFFGLSHGLILIGAFVWTDGVVFSIFWVLATIITLLFVKQFPVFLLVYSIFWGIRSLGEVIYWLLEQFAPHHRNPPNTLLPMYRFFPNESVWVALQIYWQLILVVSIVADIFLIGALNR